jgi:T-complex protein 1 subunit delta
MEDQKPAPRNGNGVPSSKSEKERDVRANNIVAAIAVADVVRTSLGPRGMDKMIEDSHGEVLITNDGATILKKMQVVHPTARMLVEMSKAQDVEAGDGTTSVAVLAGAFLTAAQQLLEKGIHPSAISDGFQIAITKALQVLNDISIPISLQDRESLIQNAKTSLASKVVAQNADLLAPIAVDAVLKIIDKEKPGVIDLRDIRIVKKLGGTLEDTEMIEGLLLGNNKASHMANGPTKVQDANIALIQFCISPPKTDMDQSVVVSNDAAMDRVIEQEKKYILKIVRKIADAKCNVLLVQKSILRDSVSDLALHFLAKKGIMVVKDIEREDIEFICKSIGTIPIAHIDQFTAEKMASAASCAEVEFGGGNKMIRINGAKNPGKTLSILLRSSNVLVLDEAERSLHDALCVVRSLAKRNSIVAGGSAVEMELSCQLTKFAKEQIGTNSYIINAYSQALEIIPYTLAENAGLVPITIVSELRTRHANNNEKYLGLDIKKVFGKCLTTINRAL